MTYEENPENQPQLKIKTRSDKKKRQLLILDERVLTRECLALSLIHNNPEMHIFTSRSIKEWNAEKRDDHSPDAVIMNPGGKNLLDLETAQEIKNLAEQLQPTPLIILQDTDNLLYILKTLECGARGYIPTCVNLDVCIEAIELAIAGGIFIPASSILAARSFLGAPPPDEESSRVPSLFTERETEVVKALRIGKANKVIAYELDIRESTVKVHIRNIMKKLDVKNRTEAAYKINKILPTRKKILEEYL